MVKFTPHWEIGEFHRGFAHLALRASVADLAILPMAIASLEEANTSAIPLSNRTFIRSSWLASSSQQPTA